MCQIKKAIIVFLVSLLIAIPVVSAKTYVDVPSASKYYEAISYLTTYGVIEGHPNGQFKPNSLINRAEVVAIMSRLKFLPTIIATALDWHKSLNHSYVIFPDVSLQAWYAGFVETAYQNNVIQGYPDGHFRPGNNTNFAEALKIILESYKADFSQNIYQANKFLYVKQGEWFEKYFTYAFQHNLINREKFYHPGQLITRGEFVDIIFRMESMLASGESEYKTESISFSDEYKITIPKLNIVNVDVNFASLSDSDQALSILKYGLGNYLNTPGSNKKIVLFGHSSGYSWDTSNYKTILRQINKLENGDRIYINYQEKGYIFEIVRSEIISASEDYRIVQNEDKNELSIYTCWPPNSIKERYIVHGRPI